MTTNAPVTARQVASYFIHRASRMGGGNEELSGNNDLTNLKLQKLLYFAQFEYLKNTGQPLFADRIEAWKYGPVVPAVYDWLKSNGSYVICELDAPLDDVTLLPESVREFLDTIWEKYGHLSAWELVQKTHEPGSPWDQVYRQRGEDQEIPLDIIAVS